MIPFVTSSASDGDGNNGGGIKVLSIIKSVGVDVCLVTQGGPIICEMRNPMTKLEDAVREAPSMAATRHILPVISSHHKKMMAYEDTCIR
jgi:hypothetical protein